MPRPLTLGDLATVNGHPPATSCPAPKTAVAGARVQALPVKECSPPNVDKLSSTQAILALEECYNRMGAEIRRGNHVAGDWLAIMSGSTGFLPLSVEGTEPVYATLAEAVDGGGDNLGADWIEPTWRVLRPLLKRDPERIKNLIAARHYLEMAAQLSAGWSRSTQSGSGVGVHGGVGFLG